MAVIRFVRKWVYDADSGRRVGRTKKTIPIRWKVESARRLASYRRRRRRFRERLSSLGAPSRRVTRAIADEPKTSPLADGVAAGGRLAGSRLAGSR